MGIVLLDLYKNYVYTSVILVRIFCSYETRNLYNLEYMKFSGMNEMGNSEIMKFSCIQNFEHLKFLDNCLT